MTGWHLLPKTAFDIESGGVDVENDGVVTVTVASIDGRNVEAWSGMIAVDFDIDPKAIEVHGITTEHAREHGKPAADVLDEAAGRLAASLLTGIPVTGMNLVFDFTILDRNCTRHGVPTVSDRLAGRPLAPVIDVLCIDKHLDRYRPGKRKLESLCEQYSVKHGGAHDATEDALAAARVAYVIGSRSQLPTDRLRDLYADRRYPDRLARDWQAFGRLGLDEVHAGQVGWYAEQSKSLGEYWAKAAEQKRVEAGLDFPPGDDELAPEERRKVLLDEAAELEQRIASLRFEWPLAVARA